MLHFWKIAKLQRVKRKLWFHFRVGEGLRAHAVAGDLSGAVRTFPEALEHLFRGDEITSHELFGTGTILGGCLFEQGRRLPKDATVLLSCPAIGVLENRVRG